MISKESYIIKVGEGPFIATAIHDGHVLRENLWNEVNLNDLERLREEDPFTGQWIDIADTFIKVKNSRFEVDVNRPREKAVYKEPEDAWGLQVWKKGLSEQLLEESLHIYDEFYNDVKTLLEQKVEKYGGFIIYDLHTYNHRREGPDGPVADPDKNPEINVGTGNINREKWAPVIDTFINTLASFDYQSKNLDVRENVKFQGGNFLRWVHSTFPDVSCVLAIEFKKFFMDEWTGKPDQKQVQLIKNALKSTIPPVMESFNKINS